MKYPFASYLPKNKRGDIFWSTGEALGASGATLLTRAVQVGLGLD